MKINITYGEFKPRVEVADHAQVREVVLEEKDWRAKLVEHFRRNKFVYVATCMTVINFMVPGISYAAVADDGGMAIIKLMQEGSFYLGIGVSIWGIFESQLGYTGWKGRVTNGVLGYIAILLLPLVFTAIRAALFV